MKQKISFIKFIRLFGIIIIISMGGCFTILDITGSYQDFKFHADQLRADYIGGQEQMIKREVDRVVDMIDQERKQSAAITRKKIKARVYEACSIAQNIYQQNKKSKPMAEIQQMILDALRPIRFEQGSGYYFATRLDGIEVLFADKPELEGSDMLGIRDTYGKYVVRDMIDIIRKSGEGFYSYHWTKPGESGNDFKKISFVKRFKPYDWFIGTGLYVVDVEEQIKEHLLVMISRIRFGKEGYIFVNRLNGDALVSNGKRISGKKKLWDVFNKNPDKTKDIFQKEFDAALKTDGGFIHYSMIKLSDPDKKSEKASFIYGIPDLKWIVGAGVYLDNVEKEITVIDEVLNNKVKSKILHFIVIVAILLIVFLYLLNWVTRIIQSDFNLFASFFHRAALSAKSIDNDLVHFLELDRMAVYANKMSADVKQAAGALKQSEANLRSVFEAAKNVAFVKTECSGKDAKIIEFSPGAELIFGYRPKEIIGKPVSLLHLHEDVENFSENMKKMREKKKGIIRESTLVRKSGETFPAIFSTYPIFNEKGEMNAALEVSIDITQRKQAEESLKESEGRYRSIVKQAAEGIVLYDLSTKRVLETNNAYQKILGYTEEEMQLLTLYDIVNHDKKSIDHYVSRIQKDKVVNIGERGHRRKDGSLVDVEVSSSIIFYRGKETLSTVVHDISQRKKTEEELLKMERLKSVGTLAGGIAHDFNNILMGLFGNISIAREKLTRDHPSFKSLERAEKSMNRAIRLTKQLLTFAKGGLPVREDTRLDNLVEEIIHFDLSGSNVKLTFNKTANLWQAKIDKGQIQQVFSNLTINAKQAMPGGGELYVTMENVELFNDKVPGLHQGKYIRITMADHGTGIDKRHLDRIFDPYFTTKHAGSGLGLATVYSILNKHGGHIGVESQLGKGTNFTIHLPASLSGRPVESSIKPIEKTLDVKEAKILVMDDEDSICVLVKEILDRSGFTVETASGGRQALEIYQKALSSGSPFDLVIMDLTIPGGMGGKETVGKILEIDPGARAIVSSGYSNDPVMADYAEYGFKGIVAKPYTRNKLLEVIGSVLGD